MTERLFSSYKLGNIELNNRIIMAPMTRSRSINNIPGDIVAEYYGQRAEAGLIITEGTSPSPNGLGYPRIPALYNEDHVKGWKKVTDAVHDGGGRIFVQLMHTGRVTHPLNLPEGGRMLAPSAVTAPDKMYTDQEGEQPFPEPKAMTEEEILSTIDEYVHSAELAIKAGFDGVELHGANGYLIDQFLNLASNKREDRWGKTVEGRIRFAIEVATKVSEKIGAHRVGIRVSPYGVFNGATSDEKTDELYTTLTRKLSDIGLAYIHVVDHSAMGAPPVKDEIKQVIRENFKGTYILSGGYDKKRAEHDLVEKRGDLVAFGRPFISNPRLPTKLRNDSELADPDFSTFYTPGEKGFTDYPVEV